MGTEIERKFLVRGDGWRHGATSYPIRQGYLSLVAQRTVRVRIKGDRAYLTVKGKPTGHVRAEYEYEIPVADARDMLDGLCERPLIEKTRHVVDVAGREWVVDVFEGDNAGLVLAEIELESEGESIEVPAWAAEEVTDDPRYLNANLIRHPFCRWTKRNPLEAE